MSNKIDFEYVETSLGVVLNEEQKNKIKKHCNKINSYEICAVYYDWEDFCSDWCDDCGYTRSQARKILHGGKGEFQIIKGLGIIRYSI